MKKILKYCIFIYVFFSSSVMNVFALETSDLTCESILGEKTRSYLTTGFAMIQVAGVVLAIILSMTDFLSSVISGEADSNKKAMKKMIVRIIVASILVIVATILKVLLNMFGQSDGSLCII